MHTTHLELEGLGLRKDIDPAQIQYIACVAMILLAVALVWLHGKAAGLDLATQDCMRKRVSVNFTEMWDIAGALPTAFGMARLVGGSF